jgi:hypothetical protein
MPLAGRFSAVASELDERKRPAAGRSRAVVARFRVVGHGDSCDTLGVRDDDERTRMAA